MEFYFSCDFNEIKEKDVSIPNGMEFYNNTPEKMGGGSIPNGMEFYQIIKIP